MSLKASSRYARAGKKAGGHHQLWGSSKVQPHRHGELQASSLCCLFMQHCGALKDVKCDGLYSSRLERLLMMAPEK